MNKTGPRFKSGFQQLAGISATAIFLCGACAQSPIQPAKTVSAAKSPSPSVAIQTIAAPIFEQATQKTAARNLNYQITYTDGDFIIRQAFLGEVATWNWNDFGMPAARIQNAIPDLGLGDEMTCTETIQSLFPCSRILELPLEGGGFNEFVLESEHSDGNGKVALKKNGRVIWRGHANGGTWRPIHSSKKFGDEIVFDYVDSNWGSINPKKNWVIESIVYTRGSNTVAIESATAPNIIQGKLAYFKISGGKEFLVFNGRLIKYGYDSVFDQFCCWDGPPIQIAGNGRLLDFFAMENGGWYHVQAGYQN